MAEANYINKHCDQDLTIVSVNQWFDAIRSKKETLVSEVPLDNLKDWVFNEENGNIEHRSGHFFSVIGLEVKTNCGDEIQWHQPIIKQSEIGILGIVKRVIEGTTWFLMQAKIEPGNINGIQLSPTVQATRSNYLQAHGGQKTTFLNYFLETDGIRMFRDCTWSEQGGRFYEKKNRNAVVEVTGDVNTTLYYRWLKSDDLWKLMNVPNVVNMDTRSVLSTMIPLHSSKETPLYDLSQIYRWRDEFVDRNNMQSQIIPLKNLSLWKKTEYDIRHESADHFFAINAVKVDTEAREIRSWDQPLIKDIHVGLIGFLVTVINDTLHFLVQGKLEAGSNTPITFAPTVQCAAYRERYSEDFRSPEFLDYFVDSNSVILYDTVQSDEGGRFFKVENRHVVVIINDHLDAKLHKNYVWLSYNQMVNFLNLGFFNIEARSLLACYIFSKGDYNESTGLGLP
jgi:oxidase EvaA